MGLVYPDVEEWKRAGVAPPGEPPDNGDMRERVAKLEAILPTLATKADVAEVRTDIHREFTTHTRWSIGIAVAIVAALIAYLNVSKPPAAALASPQPQPIVIQLPPQPASVAPSAPPLPQPPK